MKFDAVGMKNRHEKIIMLTAYDFQMAKILDEAGIDLILVGDSLGMVMQGFMDTKSVTIEDMLYHTKAVSRGAKNTPVIGDMPINSYRTVEDALNNAKLFLEAGADGVKIEGNKPEQINALLDHGIPVMGHLGLLPQTAGSYRVKGKKPEEAQKILKDALDLDQRGVFSMVLECIPESLAKKITETVKIPTIGIGAGKYCNGQVLVINDMLGFDLSFAPRYLKRYANLNKIIKDAVARFKEEVSEGTYPDKEHTYH
ncbi:MAG: 3-methyl-2-oxobutanoate hydroxymethyltransferase [Candidatus Bathyarchaeota archaeon]|nr:MAG: 3-methyl-2-oxobutanoate hydroxymethyltransferase [Candidatus Bathyarchaeota archaeon]